MYTNLQLLLSFQTKHLELEKSQLEGSVKVLEKTVKDTNEKLEKQVKNSFVWILCCTRKDNTCTKISVGWEDYDFVLIFFML